MFLEMKSHMIVSFVCHWLCCLCHYDRSLRHIILVGYMIHDLCLIHVFSLCMEMISFLSFICFCLLSNFCNKF